MMIMRIIQGPGNQMFQYAYALATSKRIGVELKLDLDWYRDNSGHRPYVLDRFNITAPIASKDEIEYVRSKNAPNFFQYRWNLLRDRFAPAHKKVLAEENMMVVDKAMMHPHRSCYVSGYFTSEIFFSDHKNEVLKELSFKGELNERSKEVAQMMKESSSVAISFRRGDFLNKKWQNVCSLEYYDRAMQKMQQEVKNPVYFVFSDELDWINKNIKFEGNVHFMDFNHPDYMLDMRLMTHCKNHIITNSTFSWWGAWLSDSRNVLCPEHWLNPDIETHKEEFGGSWVEFSHVLPKSWKRIPNLVAGDTFM